jgi:hypothetical protein
VHDVPYLFELPRQLIVLGRALQAFPYSAKLLRMSNSDLPVHVEQKVYDSRLRFLYMAVEDTQNTIRFLDTKAGFCVTLISATGAVLLQHYHAPNTPLETVLLSVFIASIALALLACMRVIFPVIKPHSDHSQHTSRMIPKFFVSQHPSHHWLRHTFSNSVDNVLCEDRAAYTATMEGASDEDLLIAMCDELIVISLIRQIKSDRLHTVMYTLAAEIALFAAIMLS